jgi:acetyltransferase
MDPLFSSLRSTVLGHGLQIAHPARDGDCHAACAGQWQTRRGEAVLIRPLQAADYSRLRNFVQALSAETRYKRYLSPRTPGDEEIGRWATIDPAHEYSLVAVSPEGAGKLLGEARYVIEAAGEAELAIAIEDGCQGQGLGRELLTRLIDAARCHGLLRLTGIALSTNRAILGLAQKFGFRLSRTPAAGWQTTLSLDLKP